MPEALRDGSAYAMHEERRDPERWRAYMRGLFEVSREEQDDNAALVPAAEPRKLVDVAGGHAGFSMAMCRRHPSLDATVLDLPPAAAVGREIVAEQGYADRVSFVEGDVFELGLGEELDVVSVFNLVHHLPEERDRELVRMAHAALRPGGWLVLGDSERPGPEGDVPRHGALSSLLFYAWSHGHNFSAAEIAGWLEQAGFEDVRAHRNQRSPWRIVVLGRA
jgi:SAM-dependent methyltransferase